MITFKSRDMGNRKPHFSIKTCVHLQFVTKHTCILAHFYLHEWLWQVVRAQFLGLDFHTSMWWHMCWILKVQATVFLMLKYSWCPVFGKCFHTFSDICNIIWSLLNIHVQAFSLAVALPGAQYLKIAVGCRLSHFHLVTYVAPSRQPAVLLLPLLEETCLQLHSVRYVAV